MMDFRLLIRNMRKAEEAGVDLSKIQFVDYMQLMHTPPLADEQRESCRVAAAALKEQARELGAVFVVDAKDLPDGRQFAAPLTRVGPVRSGSLREFEDPPGSDRPRAK